MALDYSMARERVLAALPLLPLHHLRAADAVCPRPGALALRTAA